MTVLTRIVTHSGNFHADDVFAVATVTSLVRDLEIVRTRNDDVLADAVDRRDTIVIDVGGRFVAEDKNYDHHHAEFDRTHRDGAPYAAFGLIWDAFGPAFVAQEYERVQAEARARGEKVSQEAGAAGDRVAAVVEGIEKHLVAPLDASDNGQLQVRAVLRGNGAPISAPSLADMIRMLNPVPPGDPDVAFRRAVGIAREILASEVRWALASLAARDAVEAADTGGPVVTLERWTPCHGVTKSHHLFVIMPEIDGTAWLAEAVQDHMVPRCPFPESWGGLRGAPLERATGMSDVVFCHRALFLVVARERETVEALVEVALRHNGVTV